MIVELDRIADLIEWRIEPNRIVGRLRMRDVNTERAVKLRLAGFSVHDRLRVRTDAQVSIALDILKDVYHGRLSDTQQLVVREDSDDEPEPKRSVSRKKASKAPRSPQPAKNKRGRGNAGGSTD